MISSSSNPRVKALRALLKNPAEGDTFAVEGLRSAEEALRAGAAVTAAYVTESFSADERGSAVVAGLHERRAEVVVLSESVMDRLSATRAPQGVVLETQKRWATLESMLESGRPLFVLDEISDPGNLGTIIRVADAFALGGVVIGNGGVSPFNDKAVRASMGSLFRVPLCKRDVMDAVAVIRAGAYEVYATDVAAGLKISTAKLTLKTAVVLGSEAHGVRNVDPDEVGLLHIDTPGEAESLNVSVAAGILAYELTRL